MALPVSQIMRPKVVFCAESTSLKKVAEKMLEERDLADEHEKQIKSLVINKDIDDRTATVFIDLVGAIVTQCE